jgi:hypothetical protein
VVTGVRVCTGGENKDKAKQYGEEEEGEHRYTTGNQPGGEERR